MCVLADHCPSCVTSCNRLLPLVPEETRVYTLSSCRLWLLTNAVSSCYIEADYHQNRRLQLFDKTRKCADRRFGFGVEFDYGTQDQVSLISYQHRLLLLHRGRLWDTCCWCSLTLLLRQQKLLFEQCFTAILALLMLQNKKWGLELGTFCESFLYSKTDGAFWLPVQVFTLAQIIFKSKQFFCNYRIFFSISFIERYSKVGDILYCKLAEKVQTVLPAHV